MQRARALIMCECVCRNEKCSIWPLGHRQIYAIAQTVPSRTCSWSHCAAAAAIAMGIKAIKHSGSTEFKFTIYKQMFLCSHESPSSCRTTYGMRLLGLSNQCNSGDPIPTCNQRSSQRALLYIECLASQRLYLHWINGLCALPLLGQIFCAHSNWTSIRNAIETQ